MSRYEAACGVRSCGSKEIPNFRLRTRQTPIFPGFLGGRIDAITALVAVKIRAIECLVPNFFLHRWLNSVRMGIISRQTLWPWRLRRPVATTASMAILVFLLVATHRDDVSRHLVWPYQGEVSETSSSHDVDWSSFAYVQYATNSDYLCNSVMIFETLDRLETRADKVLMYDSTMVAGDLESAESYNAQLLRKARDEYEVQLQPIQVQHKDVASGMSNLGSPPWLCCSIESPIH